MNTLLKPFNHIEELNNMIIDLKTINNIKIDLIDNQIMININDNIIKVYYDNCFHLFIKTNNLDTELITSEYRLKDDILDLIKLYK